MMKQLLLLLLMIYPLTESMLLPDKGLVQVAVDETIAYAGMDTEVVVRVTVEDGYHIQANNVNDESLIPTTLDVISMKGIIISKPEFPPARQFKLEGTESALDVYDGKFLIRLMLSAGAKMKAGNYVMTAKLRYQACDTRSCFFPRTVEFLMPIQVKKMRG